MRLFVVAMLAVSGLFAQSEQPKGAKGLFLSADSGQQVPLSSSTTPSAAAPAATGLKYYIELREPDGKLERVSVSRVFHSGDRIRLHVATNVDGELVIYQKQEGEAEERLFPAANMPDERGRVTRGADIPLPSAHGWFQFDDHPGQIHLTMMVTARDGRHGDQLPSAESAHRAAGATRGSKALRIEEDATDDHAQYKVVDSRADAKIPAGEIATEVTLSHAK
jgi:hypothetical protein